MTGAHVSVRAYAQPVLIGSGRRLVSSVLAWRHVLGANYAREGERCDPVRKLPVIPSHGMEMWFWQQPKTLSIGDLAAELWCTGFGSVQSPFSTVDA